MNNYLKYQPPAVQFLAFLGLAGGFLILESVVSNYFFKELSFVLLNENATISPALSDKFKWAQLSSSIISFIIPSLLFGYYSSPRSLPYIGLQRHISLVIFAGAVILLFVIMPFIGWLGELNAKANFGSWQKSLMRMEAIYNRALQLFLQMKTFGDLLINLLVMGLLPALGEEMFFRGSLQKVLIRLSNKPWLAIVASALIFAILHGTFFKILPIFMLGLLLGLVYHFTRNLWYTILIHFLNNAFAVLSVYYADRSEFLKKLAGDQFSVPLYGAFVSLIIGIAIIYYIKRKSDDIFPAINTSDNNDYIA